MNIKLLLRTVLFLAFVFVMIYVGMTNTENIKFNFPLACDKPIVQPAAIIYFAIFAAGVLAGTLFNVGGGKSAKSSKAKE